MFSLRLWIIICNGKSREFKKFWNLADNGVLFFFGIKAKLMEFTSLFLSGIYFEDHDPVLDLVDLEKLLC